jgi:glycerate kinase
MGVARLCKQMGVPCVALAGSIEGNLEALRPLGLDAWFSICPAPITLDEAIKQATHLLQNAAANVLAFYRRLRCEK